MTSQLGLFAPPPPPADVPQVLLDDTTRGCSVRYWPRWLPTPTADALLAELLRVAPFAPEVVVIAGRSIEVRRRSCAFGSHGTRYRYTGVTREAHPWPAATVALAASIGMRAEAATIRKTMAELRGEA